MSTSLRPIRKTTEASTALGRYCRGFVRKSRTIATIDGGGELRHLRMALRLVDHLRLGRAAVDDEGAAEAGSRGWPGRVRRDRCPSSNVLAVLDGVGARGGGALRENHEEHRGRRRDQRGRVAPGDAVREADVRQPARHGAEDRDVVRGEVEDPARCDRPDRRRRARRAPPSRSGANTIRIASTDAETSVVCHDASAMSQSVSPNLRSAPLKAPSGHVRRRDRRACRRPGRSPPGSRRR